MGRRASVRPNGRGGPRPRGRRQCRRPAGLRQMTLTTPFSDLIVLEWGRRTAVRACGSLLAQVGAKVLAPATSDASGAFARFKTAVADTSEARALALEKANIVLVSSDR